MSRVLLVGDDSLLLRTRAALLRPVAAEIVCCCAAQALTVQAEKECDLVVVGHSLRPEMCAAVVGALRERWPKTRILLLTRLSEMCAETALPVDGISSTEPERLIYRAAELLRPGAVGGRRGASGGAGAAA